MASLLICLSDLPPEHWFARLQPVLRARCTQQTCLTHVKVRMQAVRWARNTRHLVAMVRQCSAEADLAQTQARHPVLSRESSGLSSNSTAYTRMHQIFLLMIDSQVLLLFLLITIWLGGVDASLQRQAQRLHPSPMLQLPSNWLFH